MEGLRLGEIASQAEDILPSIAMSPHDAGDRTDPMPLEDLIGQAGQVYRGLEEVRQLVSGEKA